MRILVANKKTDSEFLSALVSSFGSEDGSIFNHEVSISVTRDFIAFDIESIERFFRAVWHVFSVLSRGSMGNCIENPRFFKVDDNPHWFFYVYDRQAGGIRYGW